MARPLIPSNEDPVLDSGWGPTPVDPSATTTASTPAEVATATQATQAANEAERAAIAASQLTPPPFGVPIVNQGGFVSSAWIPWITKVYRRIGSSDSLTPDELSMLDAFSSSMGIGAAGGASSVDQVDLFGGGPVQVQGLLESLYLLLDPWAARFDRVVWDDWNLARDFTPVAGAGVPARNAFQGNIVKDQFAVGDAIQWQSAEALHDWKEGTDLEVHLHWALGGANDLTVRGVKWEIEWTACNPLESGVSPTAFPATSTQSAEFTIPASQPDRTHRVGTIYTIPAGTLKVGAQILIRLKRIAAAGTAPAADPFLISFGIHYQSDTRGSRTTFSK